MHNNIDRVVLFGPVADWRRKREIAVSAITCLCCLWTHPAEYRGLKVSGEQEMPHMH